MSLFSVGSLWLQEVVLSKTTWNHFAVFLLTLGGMPRRSPFGNVSSLLSSRTLFKFSTHSGSTSPSKMIHCLLLISPRTLSMILKWRKIKTVLDCGTKHYLCTILKLSLECGNSLNGLYMFLHTKCFRPLFSSLALISKQSWQKLHEFHWRT